MSLKDAEKVAAECSSVWFGSVWREGLRKPVRTYL